MSNGPTLFPTSERWLTAARVNGTRGRAIIALVVVALLAVAGMAWRSRSAATLRIASGGTLLPVAREFADGLSQREGLKATVVDLRTLTSILAAVERGEVEMALLVDAGGTFESAGDLRLLAPLYLDVLHVVARREITTLSDLVGKRLAIGPSASATERVALAVLEHVGIHRKDFDAQNMEPLDGASKLERGEIDATFVLAGVTSNVVEQLMTKANMNLLSLGEPGKVAGPIQGLHAAAPFLVPTAIPEGTYGPKSPAVGTVGVKALLVARADVDDSTVLRVTRTVFADKQRLAQIEKGVALLTERFDPSESPYPLHPAADHYLRRNEPSALERNSGLLSALLTGAAILWSLLRGVHAWRTRGQKVRVEVYFRRVALLRQRLRAARTEDDFTRLIADIDQMKRTALDELASERLDANEGFQVLQTLAGNLHGDIVAGQAARFGKATPA